MVVGPAVWPDSPKCNENGTATFNWLLQFDTTAGTLKTGGAKPVADPATMGYAFDNEMLSGKQIAPITVMAKPDAMGNFSVSMGMPLNVPIFLDPAGMSAVVLPLQQSRLKMGTLSSKNNCIGSYNAKGLDPTANCMPDGTHPLFIAGGSLDGFITLEDADTVVVKAINETLCVLLSNNAPMYGTTGTGGVTVCKRDPTTMKILYQGGWCSMTNAAAANGCADAEQLTANFAASSVKINP
jgi:hypothetical protein